MRPRQALNPRPPDYMSGALPSELLGLTTLLGLSTLHGESAGVDTDVCKQWKEQLPCLCEGYSMKDICNIDETGIFFW